MRVERVLVLGASGFVGSHICNTFTEAGYSVIPATRQSSDLWRIKHISAGRQLNNRIIIDLNSSESVKRCVEFSNPDLIVNCAAYGVDSQESDIRASVKTNVFSLLDVLENAKGFGVKGILHVGTSYEYGDHEGRVREDASLVPISMYGASKAAAALIGKNHALALDLPFCIIRPFTMVGAYESPAKVIPRIIRACLTKQPVKLTQGLQKRDYVAVKDVAHACLCLVRNPQGLPNDCFNIGTGTATCLKDLGQRVVDLLGAGGDMLCWGELPYRTNEIMSNVSDSSKIYEFSGWRPSVPLLTALQEAIDFEKLRLGLR